MPSCQRSEGSPSSKFLRLPAAVLRVYSPAAPGNANDPVNGSYPHASLLLGIRSRSVLLVCINICLNKAHRVLTFVGIDIQGNGSNNLQGNLSVLLHVFVCQR